VLYRGRDGDKPITESFLDTDFYKFTMGDFIFSDTQLADAVVTLRLKCRTKNIKLGNVIPMTHLREELDHARRLKPTNSELYYLRGMDVYGNRMLSEPYLQFLKNINLPEYNMRYTHEGDIELEFAGPYKSNTYWELFGLSIVNELYHRYALRKCLYSEAEHSRYMMTGLSRLLTKVEKLRQYPDLTFSDFGTRRRASRDWQEEVVEVMATQLPKQFRGTSNVYLAMKYNLVPIGTSAHELFMVAAGLADIESNGDRDAIRASQNEILGAWWDKYGHGLSIALTDTFGTKFTFDNAPAEVTRDWKGTRQDSGDPLRYKQKALQWYRWRDVNPKEKMIVFSDGLDVDSMIRIHKDCQGEIIDTYGWGTNLTNDFEPRPNVGLIPLSLVIKPATVNGRGLVKLSDNIAKAMGIPKDIARYKKIFDYDETYFEPCMY